MTTNPESPTAEHRTAEAVAAKIMEMANKPVDDLIGAMTLLGFGPDHRRIVLEQMARHALKKAYGP